MKNKKKHISYLGKHYEFVIDCNTDAFKSDEIEILEKYSHWFHALCSGPLEPFTIMMQEPFISVYKGEYEPFHIYKVVWIKYLGIKKMEAKPGDHEDKQYLPYEDTFYNRDMYKQNRKMMYGVMSDNHQK